MKNQGIMCNKNLIEKDDCGNWEVKGLPWEKLREGQVITKETSHKIYGCLCKLKEYESTGLTPGQIERIHDHEHNYDNCHNYTCAKKHYNEGFEEGYNKATDDMRERNEWIPCESEMPKEHDSIFAKAKGTDKWNDAMFEKISDDVNVTVVDKFGNGVTTHAHTVDGKWVCDLLRCNKSYRIIAWQTLPQPYERK